MKHLKYFEALQNEVTIGDISKEDYNKVYNMITDFNSNGIPKIGLYKKGVIIGAILIDDDYLPNEYRFDIIIKKGYRGRGYLKLLINKLIEDFQVDDKVDQLSAVVVNKKLSTILGSRFGFTISEFDGDDFAFLSKKY